MKNTKVIQIYCSFFIQYLPLYLSLSKLNAEFEDLLFEWINPNIITLTDFLKTPGLKIAITGADVFTEEEVLELKPLYLFTLINKSPIKIFEKGGRPETFYNYKKGSTLNKMGEEIHRKCYNDVTQYEVLDINNGDEFSMPGNYASFTWSPWLLKNELSKTFTKKFKDIPKTPYPWSILITTEESYTENIDFYNRLIRIINHEIFILYRSFDRFKIKTIGCEDNAKNIFSNKIANSENPVILFLNDIEPKLKKLNIRFHKKENKKEAIEWLLTHKIWSTAGDIFYYNNKPKFLKTVENFLNDLTLKHATRAAISQVMARNMSHNIGSHVMNHLIEGKKVEHIAFDNDSYNSLLQLNENEQKTSSQLAFFNNYIKCRMDYLSEVTFGIPSMQTSKNIYSEVFKEFDKVRILLNNISGIKDFSFRFNFLYNGVNCTIDDVSIAFPSDVLGVQAFYNILENIIRNTAKHDQNKNANTIFTIHIQDIHPSELIDTSDDLCRKADSLYKVEITDGIKKNGYIIEEDLTNLEKENYKDYHNYNKKDDINWSKIARIDWLVDYQNIRINQSVLDQSNNQLRTNSLGLLEMEASASFLRKIDIPEIESNEYQVLPNNQIFNNKTQIFNILKAINIEGALGYRLFLNKPQDVLFVGKWDIPISCKSNLLKVGVWFISAETFKQDLNSGIIYHHQFVIYDETIVNEENKVLIEIFQMDEILDKDRLKSILSQRSQLPIRCLKINDKQEIYDCINSSDFKIKHLEIILWRNWINFKFPKLNLENIEFQDSPLWADKFKNKNYILFLNHTDSFSFGLDNNSNKLKENILFMEPLSSYAQSKLPDNKDENLGDYFNPIDAIDGFNKLCKYKLIESSFLKIIVLDERIQHFSQEKYCDILNFEIFQILNIIIPSPTSGIQLDNVNFNEYSNRLIQDFIIKNISDHSPSFLLIHYGIIERMFNNNKSKIDSFLIELAKRIRVIVTSGRGKQSLNLPIGICYVNLSPITNVFIENRSKYSINYLLSQSRK